MLEKKGQVVLDLRPSAGNPRNSEGAFLELKDGRLLFAYSKFYGESNNDEAPARIVARYSDNRGNTWSDDEVIASPEDHNHAQNIMGVSLLRMANGDIGLFYIIRYGWHDLRVYIRRSNDEGKTWGEANCCQPGLGCYNVNNDRVVRLSSGRLIIPSNFHKICGEEMNDPKSRDFRGSAFFYLSDDDGITWREAKGGGALAVPHSASGLQEAGVIELRCGTVWAWCRTDLGRQFEMFSTDGGETWSQPVPSQFTSPNSPLSMKRIPGNGHLLAVWNPIPNYQTRVLEKHSWGRTPLVGAISKDDGKTWGSYFAIETEEDRGGYCYTAIHFVDDSVLLAYCAGEAEDGSCLARLKIRKISLADII